MFKSLSHFYFNKALQQARDEQISTAVQHLAKAVSYDRQNIEAWNLAGLCYYRLGKYKTAEFCWTRSINERPAENGANAYLADLTGSFEEAAPYFPQVAFLCEHKRYGEAAGIMSKNICSRFDAATALLNYLGVLYVLDGKISRAVKCWRSVLAMDRTNTTALRYLEGIENRPSYRLHQWKERLWQRLWQKNNKA